MWSERFFCHFLVSEINMSIIKTLGFMQLLLTNLLSSFPNTPHPTGKEAHWIQELHKVDLRRSSKGKTHNYSI